MRIFDFFRPPRRSAATAKERLQILLAHERGDVKSPDRLLVLQQEILKVIARYYEIDEDKVEVRIERGRSVSTLEVNIELPGAEALAARFDRPATAAAG